MTPPDSGERCPWSGYTDNNLSGQCSLRRGHDGPHEIARPDSGEREVQGAQMDVASGPRCWCGKPSTYPSGWCGQCTEPEVPGHEIPYVRMPLPLAQRILAALERADFVDPAIIAELRARLPR